jgi:hypothetical protein
MPSRALHPKAPFNELRLYSELLSDRGAQPLGGVSVNHHHITAHAGLQCVWRIEGHEPSLIENPQTVTSLGLVQDVRGQENRHPFLPAKRFKVVGELTTSAGVETTARLIEEQESWAGQESFGKLNAPLQTSGEVLDTIARSVCKTKSLEQLVGPTARRPPPASVEVPVLHDVLNHRQLGVQARLLEDNPEMAPDLGRLKHHIMTEDATGPAGGSKQRGEDPKECGLPTSIRAEETKDLTPSHAERHPIEGLSLPVLMGEAQNVNSELIHRGESQ